MKKFVALLIVAFMLGGCAQKVPKDALQLSPTSLADRQMQTRRFETGNYEMMLTAASQVFQDLGFNLDETERQLGILVGSKKRSAVSGGQIAGAILLAIFTGVAQPTDKEQIIRASLVMSELDNGTPKVQVGETKSSKKSKVVAKNAEPAQSTVRVTFQRVVINTQGQATRAEQINDPKIYQDFFDKLSQAVFLEAHEL